MSKGSVTPLTIGLLVIGLIVGLGGGYIVANNTSSPKIETLENSILSLDTQLSENTNEITDLEASISELDTEKNQKENTLSDIQEELSEVLSEKTETQDMLDSVIQERISLEKTIYADEGYNVLALFGFSLEYPTEMELSMVSTMYEYIDDSYGGILGEGETTAFTIVWEDINLDRDTLENALNGIIDNLEDIGEVDAGTLYEVTIAGTQGRAVDIAVTDDESQTVYGKYYACYSESQGLLYKFSITAEDYADLEVLAHIIESVKLEES